MTADPWGGLPRPPRPQRPTDPDELRVVGLRRRAAVARAVNEVCRGVEVRAFEFGWTVSTIAGYICVCHTLDDLLTVAAPVEEYRLLRATVLAAADSAGA
ncbi:MAG: hypothetical protein L0I76_31160 [Pseudonocardia sp.]|nr:hypothetical protein [Pseudonocardia sp.]